VHDYPASTFFALLNDERCLLEAEVIHGFGKHDRQDFFLMVAYYPVVLSLMQRLNYCAWLMLTAIHEEILSPRVAMDVDEYVDVSALESLAHHLFH